jgi:type I restriction enzyme M protein
MKKNTTPKFELSKEDNLLKRFEEIHDYIYSHDGLSPQQTLEEFIKILFIKIVDENENLNRFSILPEEWNNLKSGKESKSLIQTIESLFEQTKQKYNDIFNPDDRVRISPIALGFTVNKLQNISLLNSSQDVKGLAFQKFLSHHEKDGSGQFFTPEPVIDFCVEMSDPQPWETIIDPACGSGGFLISSLKFLQKNNLKLNTEESISNYLYGLDINKSIARIAKMKLLLEGNVKTNIFCTNSLEDIDSLKLSLNQKDGFDIVLTNPPFGAKITNPPVISAFDMGYKWKSNEKEFHKTKNIYPNQNAEILFIERCLQLLKEGGRMAIVLPNGNFENPSLDYLRAYIKLKAKILAIVALPPETFIPYGTGVKTSIIFLKKDSSKIKKEYNIFFGKVRKTGYQGNKNGTPVYKKNGSGVISKDMGGKPILDEDFSEISKTYKKFQDGDKLENENCFSINSNELNGRFDFDFYSPENRKMLAGFDNKNTVRLGDICDIVKIKSKKLKEPDLTVYYIELSDINTNSYEIINSTTYTVHELPSRASYELKEGDIISAIAGNSVGTQKHATALVTDEFENSICTNGFRVMRNFKIDPYFLLYFFKSEAFLKQMFMYRTGAAIPSVSDTDLANIVINLPDENTIKFISEKMKKALELRQEAKRQIESLQ